MDQATLYKTAAAAIFAACDMVAALTLIAYDSVLLFPKEKQYVWGAKWTPGKVLFLAVRYLPLLDAVFWPFKGMLSIGSPLSCASVTYWQMAGTLIASFLADVVYGLRAWALWNRNRAFGLFLLAVGVGDNVACLWVLIAVQSHLAPQRIPGFPGCFVVPFPTDGLWKAYLIGSAFELVIFLATVIKGIHHWTRHAETLTTVLYRDALLAFLGQLCVELLNSTLLIVKQDLDFSMDATYRAFLSILPARIILNIREAVREGGLDRWDMTTDPYPSDDSWASRPALHPAQIEEFIRHGSSTEADPSLTG